MNVIEAVSEFFATLGAGFASPAGLVLSTLVGLMLLLALAQFARRAAIAIGQDLTAAQAAAKDVKSARAAARKGPAALPQAA